jgi:hypothetical protein
MLNTIDKDIHPKKTKKIDLVYIKLSMSCDIFYKYELTIPINRIQYSRKYTNKTEKDTLQNISQFLCKRMKKYIEDSLINEGKIYMLPKLEKIFPKFHIHGLTSHEILYPYDQSNSSHCRGDGKVFICSHC